MEYSTTEFEALYKNCFPSAMRLATSMLHDKDEARDVVQEMFLKLWESDFRVENPMAFILKGVRNRCLNRIDMMDSREKIRKRIMLECPPDELDFESRNDEIMTAVQQLLTPRERDVVDRIYSEGMSYRDTAENLEVSIAAVNKYIVSALRKLRNHFKTGKS